VIGGIGATIAGIASPTEQGIAGSAVYILHAMVTMTALYLAAGLIEKLTGETDTRQMGGLYAAVSWPSILFLLLALAVAGVPPFLGFWPKLLLLEAALDGSGIVSGSIDWGALLLAGALLLNALLTLIAGSRLWSHMFWRAGPDGPMSETPNPKLRALSRRETWLGLAPALLLALLVLAAGIVPDVLFRFGETAARDLLTPSLYVEAVGLP
jgi:multicomponent Na+:H+ antiporter subunit D